MNAVQFPLDPKIVLHQGDAAAPYPWLGFEKASGGRGYRAVFKAAPDGPVEAAIADLTARLERLAEAPAQVVCLGHDSRWFVEHARGRLPAGCALRSRELMTIPHPSSWWRNAEYRQRAVDAVDRLLGRRSCRPQSVAPA
jgi:hypothetical protein